MSLSLRKSFLCIQGIILLIFIFVPVSVENYNILLPIKLEYTAPAVYGQGGDDADTDEVVENGEEVPQQLQQDGTDNNNNEGNNGNGNTDPSQSDQINRCPEVNTSGNTPIYADQDGCHYPCPSSEDQSSIPQGCPVESPQQATSGFSINEERPIQPQQQEQQQSEQPPQQNTQTNPNQNTLTSPRINSDTTITTTSNIPTTETTTTTTTQKSLNPAGQFKSGSGLTGLNIPKSFYDPAVPFNPGAGNAGMKGSSIIPNTNPVTPIEPGNVPSKIEDRWAHLTVYSNSTTAKPVEICVFISDPYEVRANPYCIEASPHGTLHILQAPGLIGIRASSNVDKVDTSNCEFRIYPKESKSCVLNITDSPFLKSKSETSGQDRLRTPIG